MLSKIKNFFNSGKINIEDLFEIYRYVIVGCGALLIDTVLYFFLGHLGFFTFEISKRISFISGALFRFFMSRHYVFKVKKRFIFQTLSYSLLYLLTFFINSYSHDFIFSITQVPVFSFLFATGASSILNFLGQKFIVFKK